MHDSLEVLENRTLLSGDPLIVDGSNPTDGSESGANQSAIGTLALTTAESGEWGPVLDWGLQAKHMVLLPTGDVLVWSTGQNASVWDAQTNTLTATPFFFGDLHCAAQITLADGRVAVFGGQDGEPHVGIEVTALFDPFTNSWTSGTVMNFARWYATATTLADGRVLVTSGDDHDEVRVTIPEIYDPVTDSWSLLTGADRSQVLYPEMFVLPDGTIYDAGTRTDTWFLDISGTGSWTEGPQNSFGSSGYAESAVTYEPGKILRVGGGDPAFPFAAVIDTTEVDPQWRDVESMEFARRRMNLVILADGSVMAVGGTAAADNASLAVLAGEIWDPETEQWTTVASMTEARMYHSTAVLLPDGRVLTGGGEASGRLHAQIYSPPYLFDGSRPTITSSPDNAAYGTNFVLETPEAADITSVALIRPGAPTHAFDQNQRYVPLSFTLEGDHLRVNAPPDGNTAPPGYYMLIIENGAGTPSVAAWIQINTSDNLAPGTITGRITDAVSGAGIAGATVSYNFGSTTTDANGNYALTEVPPGEHLVTILAPGYATYNQSQQVDPNQTATLNIGLVAPGQISGIVTSLETGNPIAGAKISYNGGSIIAGADGRYLAPEIPSGLQTIIASKVGFDNVQQTVTLAPNGSLVVDFSLPTALTAIEGEVRDSETGAPIVDAIVMFGSEMTMTNASGFYIFRDVPAGQYNVSVTAANYVGMAQHVIVESGFATTADFNLALRPTTTTTVAPTDDALVKISNPTKNYGQQNNLRLKSGSDAYRSFLKFNISNLDGGVHKATLRLWSFDGSNSTGSIYLVSNNLNGSGTAWTENNITWNNAPVISGTPLSSVVGTGTGVFVDFDVTQAITGNGIFSFGMLNTTSNSMYFYSTEGVTPPQLIIESFLPDDGSPIISDFTPTSGNAGIVVTIHGINFNDITGVLFNGVPSTQVGFVSDMEVRALVPVGVSTGPITVTTAAGVATSAMDFTVISAPPSIVTTVSSLSYTENAAAPEIDPGLAITDPDSTNLVSASVAITSGFATGQDVLAFEDQRGITGSYNAATGVMTLTGVSSVANYQFAMRRITYANTSENPSAANRVITFTVNDGAQSVSATRTITVTPVNDAPTANNNAYTMNQGGTLNANDTTGSTGSTNDDGVLRNDTDPENNTLSATIVNGPTHASSFILNPNGTFTYTHNGDAATSDSFTYQASDNTDSSNIATVTITINPVVPSPEVTVLGNAVSIADGDATPAATDFTDFGSVTQGGSPVSRSFTIRNDGTATLNLSGLVVPTGFTITDSLVASLAAGDSDTLTVQLDTATSGTKSGQISFSTDDDDENPFNFSITGTVTIPLVPEVAVLGNGISIADGDATPGATDFTDFGSALQGGSPISRSFTVRNDGTATLNLSGLVVPAGFTITDPLVASLAAGDSDTLTVQLDTATSGTKSGEISFTTNDSDENPFNFNISGTVTPVGSTTTVSLQDGVNGYLGTTDSHINGDQLTKNYATSTALQMHGGPDKASLIRWNTSSIPTNAVVQSASITVNVTNQTNQAYEIYALLRPWVESQVTWTAAATGSNWATAGAQGGTDRGSTVLGSITAPTNGLVTINLNAAGIAQVQSWINTPSTNNGIVFQDYAATDGLDFDSSEATTVANRPKLTITYGSGSPLLAAAAVPVASVSQNGSRLTEASLAKIGDAAMARWLATAPAGMHDAIRRAADSITFAIADLPDRELGISFGHTILIDRSAAGFGWFIDSTPRDNREFGLSNDASQNSPAYGRMDLLTVVAHEIGHLLGYDHDSPLEVMHDSLEAGHRAMQGVDAFFQGVGSAYGARSLNPFASDDH